MNSGKEVIDSVGFLNILIRAQFEAKPLDVVPRRSTEDHHGGGVIVREAAQHSEYLIAVDPWETEIQENERGGKGLCKGRLFAQIYQGFPTIRDDGEVDIGATLGYGLADEINIGRVVFHKKNGSSG